MFYLETVQNKQFVTEPIYFQKTWKQMKFLEVNGTLDNDLIIVVEYRGKTIAKNFINRISFKIWDFKISERKIFSVLTKWHVSIFIRSSVSIYLYHKLIDYINRLIFVSQTSQFLVEVYFEIEHIEYVEFVFQQQLTSNSMQANITLYLKNREECNNIQ